MREKKNSVAGGSGLSAYEPDPIGNEHPAIYDLLFKDLQDRDNFGKEKYGVRLQPFNGRDGLKDAFQEVLDLAVYLRQRIYEDEHQPDLRAIIAEAKQAVQVGADSSTVVSILERADHVSGCEGVQCNEARRPQEAG